MVETSSQPQVIGADTDAADYLKSVINQEWEELAEQ
jgi:hypothetical protein